MKKQTFIIGLVIFLMSIFQGFGQDHKLAVMASGTWVGSLKIQSTELRLVVNISYNPKDSVMITLDSPDQGARDIPASFINLRYDSLVFKSAAIKGTYAGRFDWTNKVVKGIWQQSGMSFPLEIKQTLEKFEVKRPQEPKPPFPYLSKDVTFKNKSANIELSGTLTVPNVSGPFPAVILITGSGPQNRDEELMGHKPFLLIADYLTRNGVAVLRYDDRGVGKSSGQFDEATTMDFASDVSAAIDFLKSINQVDTNKIGLIGHSEGGLIAPIVATQRNDVHTIVLMAGPGLPGEKILLEQSALIARAGGSDEKTIKETGKRNQEVFNILKKNRDKNIASDKVRKVLLSSTTEKKDSNKDKITDEATNAQIKSLTSPWFRFFLTFDPAKTLSKVKCPVLAINGSLDLQVSAKENLEAIEKAMIFGGNSDYKVEELPGLNHLFQTAKTGLPDEYAKIEETIAPSVLKMILEWVIK